MRVALMCWVAAVLLGAPAWAQPAITFEHDRVVASSVSPGGQVAWFSVAREQPTMVTEVVVRQDVVVADASGTATLLLDREPPRLAVWAVVDVTSAEYAVVTSPGFPRRDHSPSSGEFTPGHARVSLRVGTKATDRAHVLLVRPGLGAWSTLAWDGGKGDADGAVDGAPSLSPKDLTPVKGDIPSPAAIRKGDVLVVIRPLDLAFLAARVAAGGGA